MILTASWVLLTLWIKGGKRQALFFCQYLPLRVTAEIKQPFIEWNDSGLKEYKNIKQNSPPSRSISSKGKGQAVLCESGDTEEI